MICQDYNHIEADTKCNDEVYLLQRNQTITLPQQYIANPSIYPTFNNTYLIHEYPSLFLGCAHFDHTGSIIKKLQFPNGTTLYQRNICMISDKMVIMVIRSPDNHSPSIVQWNLQNGQTIQHQMFASIFQNNRNIHAQLFYFSNSQYICLVEFIYQAKTVIYRCSTFKTCLCSAEDKPIAQFQGQINYLTYSRLFKLNHDSKVAWAESTSNYTEITIMNIIQNKQTLGPYKLKHTINPNQKLTTVTVTDIWQPRQGFLYVKCKLQLDTKAVKSAYPAQQLEKNRDMLQAMQKSIHLLWNYETDELKQFTDCNFCTIQFTNGLRSTQQIEVTRDKRMMFNCSRRSSKPIVFPPFYQRLGVCYVQTSQWSVIDKQPVGKLLSSKLGMPSQYNYLDYQSLMYYKIENKSVNDRTLIHITTRKLLDLCFSHAVVVSFLISVLIEQCNDDLIMAIVGLTQMKQFQSQVWKPATF